MKCSGCGEEISDNARFCPYCGIKVSISISDYEDSDETENEINNEVTEVSQSMYSEDSAQTGKMYSRETERENGKGSNTQTEDRIKQESTTPAEQERSERGLAIAGLVLGICSIIFRGVLGIVGMVCGIVGIVLSAKSLKIKGNGMARAGLVLSIIGLCICVIMVILLVAMGVGYSVGMFRYW